MKTRDTHVHTPCRPARAATLVVLVAAWLPLSDAGAQTAFGQPQSVSASGAADIRAVLDRYCVGCHNERLLTGGLALDTLDAANPAAAPERWERVIQKLRTGTMPPAGRPRPDIATYHAVAGRLEAAIDASAAADPDPGRTSTVHRLNRTEYRHAIRDLLALDIDVTALLPGDETSDTGFDNNADVLSISTAHLERYLSAARHITRLATGLPPTGPGFETFEVPLLLLQDDRQSPDLPLGSRGGTVVRYNFPVEGEYLIKIRLRTNWQDYILGMGTAQQLDVRIDGALAKRFTVGGGTTGRPAPATFTIAEPGDPEWETYVLNADDDLEVRVQVMAGPRVVGVSFVRRVWEPEGVFQAHQAGEVLSNDEAYYGNAAVDSVSIGGPYNMTGASDTPSRRAIFVCRPAAPSDEGPCAARILSRLARRAYRRPVRDDDRETLLGFFQRGRAEGGSFDAGVQLALERLLVDPDFLLRVEADPAGVAPGDVYRLSDLEVASRLSFFLWSSLPDEPLLVDAERGTLTDPAVLDRQARRLLADPRAASLVEDFATQWLHLRNLSEVRGDPVPFPDFDDNLVEAFQTETELFLTSTLRQEHQRAGAAERRLHVRQRTVGAALRDPRRLRHPVQAGQGAGPRATRRAPGTWQRAGADLLSDPYVAGTAGQVAARHDSRRAATVAAARRAPAPGPRRRWSAGVGARAARAAPERPGVRRLSRKHRPAGVRARALRRARSLADAGRAWQPD